VSPSPRAAIRSRCRILTAENHTCWVNAQRRESVPFSISRMGARARGVAPRRLHSTTASAAPPRANTTAIRLLFMLVEPRRQIRVSRRARHLDCHKRGKSRCRFVGHRKTFGPGVPLASPGKKRKLAKVASATIVSFTGLLNVRRHRRDNEFTLFREAWRNVRRNAAQQLTLFGVPCVRGGRACA